MYHHNDDKTEEVNSALQIEFRIVKVKLGETTKNIVDITDENEKYKEKVVLIIENVELAKNEKVGQVKTAQEQLT